jgi:glycosyltransferase involved in cell wall biosynthesis
MRVWLITVGEPLPGLSGNSRLWRTGLLAQQLVARGHTVTWWTSRVDHFGKKYFETTERQRIEPSLELRLLDGRLYTRNVSVARLVNHWQIGREFRARTRSEAAPDVIFCSFPTIELSFEAVRFGRERGVPVILDVRDLWPDIFVQPAPKALRGLLGILLRPYFIAARSALAEANAITAVSKGYLEWGLRRAGRQLRATDRVFPLAYSFGKPSGSARSEGIAVLREKLGVEDGRLTCVFAGTLGRTYDLAPVLEVAARAGNDPSLRLHFLICGDGERAAIWRQAAQRLANVTFTGWLEENELRAVLSGADIGLAAYAAEAPQGLPNKVIEYLAAGLPIVSSLTGETEAMLRLSECGVTYTAGSAASLYEALRALSPATVRERLSTNARRKFETDFEAESIYGQLAGYLETMAKQGKGIDSTLPPKIP